MAKRLLLLSIAVGFIIFIRTILNSSDNLVYIVAVINIISIMFVICTIIDKIISIITDKIKQTKAPTQIIKREVKNIRFKIWGLSIISIIFVTIFYLTYLCSSLGNDIISILALGLSILDSEIAKGIAEIYKI